MCAASSSPNSLAEEFRKLPQGERRAKLEALSVEQAQTLLYDWGFWARPNQQLPGNVNQNTADGSWTTWLILAGRGFGKTRIGAEAVRRWVKEFPIVNIAGPTASDARDVMVEGESGILAICPPDERPVYVASKRQLQWPNGAKSLIFSADEPERFRGPQCYKFWADELAAWRYEESWDQAMFGLRLGSDPQAIVTTTPKPTKLIKELVKAPTTYVTRGTSYENRANLAKSFYAHIITKYEGTRLGRQELNAELLEDNPGALWTRTNIDANRVAERHDLQRIVVGVDPAVTSNENSDETGIVVCGRDGRWPPHFYVIDDLSLIASPDKWAEAAVAGYKNNKADRVVAETNNGGDLVEAVLRTKDLNLAYKSVHASRGKITRAEPIAALYEQNRVHHIGALGTLEDQMCDYNPATADNSPDRMDALVWALWELSDGGYFGLTEYMKEQEAKLAKVETSTDLIKPVTIEDAETCPFCQSKSVESLSESHSRCTSCMAIWPKKPLALSK